MKSFVIGTLHQMLLADRIKEKDMDEVFGMDGIEEKCIQFFGGET
jgi:hypothetical protein